MTVTERRPASYSANNAFVENAEILLCHNGHVRDVNDTAHKGRPWLLGGRQKLREIPELLFAHLYFADPVVEHPSSEHGEAAAFGIAEHRLW
jgi:hypothetical protein